MIFHRKVRLMAIVLSGLFVFGATSVAHSEDKAPKGAPNNGLQQRIDFGNAYILGQSIKSGAVYLLHRKQSEIKGMLEVRQDYRKEIMEDYGLEKTAIVTAREPETQSQPESATSAVSKKLRAEKQ